MNCQPSNVAGAISPTTSEAGDMVPVYVVASPAKGETIEDILQDFRSLIRAQVETANDVVFPVARCQHQQWSGALAFPQRLRHGKPIASRQADVQHNSAEVVSQCGRQA